MTVGLWCVWWGPNRSGRRWWDKPFFAAGMRDKRKFEGGIRDGKRRVWSGKLVILMEGRGNSYFFSLFCFVLFFFRPENEVGNGNALDIHDYTIPWRKPSLPRVLFKPFDIKKMTSKSCYFIQKNFSSNNNTANTKATWNFPIFGTEKPSFFRAFSEKKKAESQFTSMGELQLKIWLFLY